MSYIGISLVTFNIVIFVSFIIGIIIGSSVGIWFYKHFSGSCITSNINTTNSTNTSTVKNP